VRQELARHDLRHVTGSLFVNAGAEAIPGIPTQGRPPCETALGKLFCEGMRAQRRER